MKSNILQMTIDDFNGQWRTKNGNCHIWICKVDQIVQLYVNHERIIDELLDFHFLENELTWAISKSVKLLMIVPEENCIILKIGEDKVEFVR